MAKAVKNRGARGEGSILFRQKMDYPKRPDEITYYPPAPSPELRKRSGREKGGGFAVYMLGFTIGIIAFLIPQDTDAMEIYSLLIPLLLILGLIAAILFLVLKNVTLAKLSRTLPRILTVAIILLFVFSILQNVMDIQSLEQPDDNASDAEVDAFQAEMEAAFENLISSVVNPGLFLLLAGAMIMIAGGTMLWGSTRILHDYIPGMIVIETPKGAQASRTCPKCNGQLSFVQQYNKWYCHNCKEYEPKEGQTVKDEEPEDEKLCEKCNKPLNFVTDYNRWFCYSCKEYASLDVEPPDEPPEPEPEEPEPEPEPEPEEPQPEPEPEPEEEPEPEPEPEEEQPAPPDLKTCSSCNGDLTYIEQYDRWYCYSCKEYAPPES